MTITLTQDNVLGRIRVDASGMVARADYAIIERSIDQITWTTCRGGSAWVLDGAGAFSQPFDDYEFPDGVPVYYRVRSVDSGASSFVGVGTAFSGDNASLTPGLPAGVAVGDMVFILASIRSSGTGTVNTPANWTLAMSSGNVALLSRQYDGVWTMPLVSFAGGAVGDTTLVTPWAMRNVAGTPTTSTSQLNGSAQNIAVPGLTINVPYQTLLVMGWKQDDWTSVATLSGLTEAAETTSLTGNDASQAIDYGFQLATPNSPGAQSFVVTGGAAAISRGLIGAFPKQSYVDSQTNSITPALPGVFIKSLRRPYLNREVQVLDYSDITRASRNAAFDVIGRTYPVGVADVMSGRAWTMTLWTDDLSEAGDLDTVLASGDIWFVHVPIGFNVPGGYVIIDGNVTRRRPGNAKRQTTRRFFDLPLIEVATPDDDVAGTTGTWATVVATYATWQDVISANATWADVLELIGSPDEVIVA